MHQRIPVEVADAFAVTAPVVVGLGWLLAAGLRWRLVLTFLRPDTSALGSK